MSITPRGDHSGALAAFGIQAGPHVGEEVPIRLPVVRIGRGGANDIVLEDDSVSATHARLEFEHGDWRITDLQSVNGTFVEGIKLAPEVQTPLPYGSTVRFGGVRLHFRPVEQADPEAARAEYTPPRAQTPIREQSSGFRFPVWLAVLVLILLVLVGLLLLEQSGVQVVRADLPGTPPVELALSLPPPSGS